VWESNPNDEKSQLAEVLFPTHFLGFQLPRGPLSVAKVWQTSRWPGGIRLVEVICRGQGDEVASDYVVILFASLMAAEYANSSKRRTMPATGPSWRGSGRGETTSPPGLEPGEPLNRDKSCDTLEFLL
jgi:hypothetical protein